MWKIVSWIILEQGNQTTPWWFWLELELWESSPESQTLWGIEFKHTVELGKSVFSFYRLWFKDLASCLLQGTDFRLQHIDFYSNFSGIASLNVQLAFAPASKFDVVSRSLFFRVQFWLFAVWFRSIWKDFWIFFFYFSRKVVDLFRKRNLTANFVKVLSVLSVFKPERPEIRTEHVRI